MAAMTEPDFREAAIVLAAVDSILCDDMDAERAISFARRWFSAMDDDAEWANGRHSGDCTKQPHSCIRCQAEEYIAEARRRYDS
jgi:hypothetical protein